MILRQGDLAFIRTGDAAPGTAPEKPVVLAKGETSGHWHTLKGGVVSFEDNDMFVVVPGPGNATVVVEPAAHASRHAPIELPPGRYRVPGTPDKASKWVGQREYTPARAVPSGD